MFRIRQVSNSKLVLAIYTACSYPFLNNRVDLHGLDFHKVSSIFGVHVILIYCYLHYSI